MNKKVISLILAMTCSVTSVFASSDKQDVEVAVDNKVLTKDVDYILTYKDNIEVGEATVIVTFIGNYTGTLEKEFTIKKVNSGGNSSGGGGGSSSYIKSSASIIYNTLPTESPVPAPTIVAVKHDAYISGYGNGMFLPDNSITRAETASMINRLFTAKDSGKPIEFTDCDEGSWYDEAVRNMSSAGIANGYTDNTFRPNNKITRAEFVTMLMQNETVIKYEDIPFTDVSKDLWYADYIYSAYKAGYISGYVDGTFCPDTPITRAEAVTILNNALGRTDMTNEKNPFTDVENTHWAYEQILEAAVTHSVNEKGESK